MATKLAGTVVASVIQRLNAPTGMNANLAALTAGEPLPATLLDCSQIRTANVASEVAERSETLKYPSLNVYCEKITNSLTEKFRTFSGTLSLAIDIRHSQDRLDGLQDTLETYIDAITQVLDANRGDWGSGLFYAGGYEAQLGPVKHGGRNFIQTAKLTFQIGVSRT